MSVNLDVDLDKGMRNNTIEAFFALVRGGLWEQEICLSQFGEVDYNDVLRLAEEQSLLGLIAAGLEHVTDVIIPKDIALQFVGSALQQEQQNIAMNHFVANLVMKLRDSGIYTILVKGQGIAQCYERPLWRACGDVDLFLSEDNYKKAKNLLLPLASSSDPEGLREKQLPMTIDGWAVELHGHLYGGLSRRIDKELNELQFDTFNNGSVSSCEIEKTHIFILSVENNIFYVFTHILQHFYKGGIGLRQICDWCRLLWVNRDLMDIQKLEERLVRAGLMSEWKAFGAFAVEYLGMPVVGIPFYSANIKWKRKAGRIRDFILMAGNFGHNRDNSYYGKYSYVLRKAISLSRRTKDALHHFSIFPIDSLWFFPNLVFNGLRSAANRE